MIHVLWDDSHFWGLMALKALRSWGVPHRLVRGTEIAQGVLSGNPGGVLLVPGGNARTKALFLGDPGADAVRDFVAQGGSYMGFCGGAGLALSGEHGLGLCPWTRRPFADRYQHFLSGHVHVHLNLGHELTPPPLGESALLPVWWPGQFDEEENDGVTVLASFGDPGPDFWVADLALRTLPPGTLDAWEDLYGIHLRPDFLRSRPCVVCGEFGQGRYLLSYAHLETPASPQANLWLAHLLSRLDGGDAVRPPLPAWDPSGPEPVWDDPVLVRARELLLNLVRTGQEHFLLFWRTPWLLGWRRGIPGAALNSLLALVCESLAREPGPEALDWWAARSEDFARDMELFAAGVRNLLLAERLAMTVYRGQGSVPGLRQQREILFGPPPGTGGQHEPLLRRLEDLFFLLPDIQEEAPPLLH